MANLIRFTENGIHVNINLTNEGKVRLLPMTLSETGNEDSDGGYPLVQVKTADYGYEGHHGAKHITAGFSEKLQYVSHTDTRSEDGTKRILRVTQQADGIYVTSHFVFYSGIAAYCDLLRHTVEYRLFDAEKSLEDHFALI